jgi:hypothetical protein
MGFDAGDGNLYRYVSNRPVLYADPSGLEFRFIATIDGKEVQKKGKEADDWFFFKAASGLRQQLVLEYLQKNKDFQAIWEFIRNNDEHVVELRVAPGLAGPSGKELFGSSSRAQVLTINPTKKEHQDNPLELADTIIHEAIHVALYLRYDGAEKVPAILGSADDIITDPLRKKLGISYFGGLSKDRVFPMVFRQHLEMLYGPSASNPNAFNDLHLSSQRVIVKIINKLLEDREIRAIAEPTATNQNVEVLERKLRGEK